jgi:hypothetical protein
MELNYSATLLSTSSNSDKDREMAHAMVQYLKIHHS